MKPKRKTTKIYNRFVSLRAQFNPTTGVIRAGAYIEIAPDEFMSNPILDDAVQEAIQKSLQKTGDKLSKSNE